MFQIFRTFSSQFWPGYRALQYSYKKTNLPECREAKKGLRITHRLVFYTEREICLRAIHGGIG